MNLFDICILMAGSPGQAWVFRKLLQRRLDSGLYPREIDFRIYSDSDEGLPGSGGGVVLALSKLLKDYAVTEPEKFFNKKRILIVNAGGKNRELPCYAPEGKLFTPVPVDSSSLYPPVALDIQLRLFMKYPWVSGELLVASGNVLADFDLHYDSLDRGGICGFGTPVSLEKGARHGVFQFDSNRRKVTDYFQKAPIGVLKEKAVLEGTDLCALEMGMLSFSPKTAAGFIRFGELQSELGDVCDSLANGKLALDLYNEVLTAAIPGISSTEFKKRVSARSGLSSQLIDALYEIFHTFPLNGVLVSRSAFAHFGSLPGFISTCSVIRDKGLRPFYSFENGEIRANHSEKSIAFNVFDANAYIMSGNQVVLENAMSFHVETALGRNLFIGGRERKLQLEVPEGICIDERKIENHTYRAVYSIGDTFQPVNSPEELLYCGVPILQWLKARGLSMEDILPQGNDGFDLWAATLFYADISDNLLSGYWKIPTNPEWGKIFKQAKRLSLSELNEKDDLIRREDGRIDIRKHNFLAAYRNRTGWRTVNFNDFFEVFKDRGMDGELKTWFEKTEDPLLRNYRQTLFQGLGDKVESEKQVIIPKLDFSSGFEPLKLRAGIREGESVWALSPVRLDLAGGWTDTPPYCLEYGGEVVNLAVEINGQTPLQVFCRRTPKHEIKLFSYDNGVRETISSFEQLKNFTPASGPLGIAKAALVLLGVTEAVEEPSLNKLCAAMGGGLELTMVSTVPNAAGLGTSSIFGSLVMQALFRFFGLAIPEAELGKYVLQLEQMTATAGGWQNHLGGAKGGVKYIVSPPGLTPAPAVHYLDGRLFSHPGAKSSMTLFYTGIKRKVRNMVEEVVHEFNKRTPAMVFSLHHIRRIARQTRRAMDLRDLGSLADCLNMSWDANKRLHTAASCEEIELLLQRTKNHWSGAKLLGSGGGGYVLFISENEAQADKLKEMLRKEFENHSARLADFRLNETGLKIGVS